MANVINNPEDLARFANELQHYIEVLSDETANIRGSFGNLGEVWQDGEYARFSETFNSLMSQIDAFKECASDCIPRLHAKADRLREYQNI